MHKVYVIISFIYIKAYVLVCIHAYVHVQGNVLGESKNLMYKYQCVCVCVEGRGGMVYAFSVCTG